MCDFDKKWPKSFPGLKALDELLRCGICYDYLRTSLITICSHNYCSLCIRKYLLYKTQCPKCFEETVETQLRNNRLIDEIVIIYTKLKDPLIDSLKLGGRMKSFQPHLENDHLAKGVLKDSDENNKSTIFIENETKNEPISSATQKNQSKNVSNKLCTPKAKTSKNDTNSHLKSPVFKSSMPRDHQSVSKNLNSLFENEIMPSTSTSKNIQLPSQLQDKNQTPTKETVIPSIFTPRKSSKPKESIKLKCPVCSVDIPEHNINTHLDSCLKEPDRNTEKTEKRQPLPKLVYHFMKESDLKKQLKQLGLSTQGDRKILENRHQRFTLLYNSECDSLRPRPVAELIQQLEREEKEERDGLSTSSSHSMLRLLDKKADPKTIEDARTKYLERHKSSYNSLIQSMRQRQQRKNTVVEKQVEDADDLSILIHLADSDKDSDNIQTNSLTRRKRRRILDSDDDDDGVGESRVTVGQKTSSDLSVRSSLVDSKPTTKIIELSDEDMFDEDMVDEDMFEEDMFDENTEVDTDFEEAMDSTKVKSQPNTNETSQSIDYIPLGQVMKEKRFQDCQDSDSESNKSISLLLLNHDEDSLLDQHMKSQINGPVIVKPINIKEELGLFDNTLDENEFSKIVSVENELLVDQHLSVGTLHESLSVNPSVSTDSQLDDPDFEVELEEMLQDSSEESVTKTTVKRSNKENIKMPTRVLRKRTKR